jgi:hypothetical protein
MVELARVEDPLKYSKYLKKLLGQFSYVGTVQYGTKINVHRTNPPPPTIRHPDTKTPRPNVTRQETIPKTRRRPRQKSPNNIKYRLPNLI